MSSVIVEVETDDGTIGVGKTIFTGYYNCEHFTIQRGAMKICHQNLNLIKLIEW